MNYNFWAHYKRLWAFTGCQYRFGFRDYHHLIRYEILVHWRWWTDVWLLRQNYFLYYFLYYFVYKLTLSVAYLLCSVTLLSLHESQVVSYPWKGTTLYWQIFNNFPPNCILTSNQDNFQAGISWDIFSGPDASFPKIFEPNSMKLMNALAWFKRINIMLDISMECQKKRNHN